MSIQQQQAWTGSESSTHDTIGGMQIRHATDEYEWGICASFIGKGGCGKTSLTGQAAKSEYGSPVLHIDAESGSSVLQGLDNVDILRPTSMGQISNIVKDITRRPIENFKYKTVVFDNCSQIQYMSIRAICPPPATPTQPEWGKCTYEMIDMVTKLRDWSASTGVNVFLNAAIDDDDKDETGKRFLKAGFTPSLAKQFPYHIDIVGILSVMNDQTRKLTFAPGEYVASKFRVPKALAVAKLIPLTCYYGADSEIMVDLLATLKGGKPFPAQKYNSPKGDKPPVQT